jgi:hypothetical protein
MSRISIMAALVAATVCTGAAQAQVNQPMPGPYGAEDGYGDDGFGWGPAYRPETNFRPSVGFYGGVERPYPYGYDQTGSLGLDDDEDVAPAPRTRQRSAQRSTRHRAPPATQPRRMDADDFE